MALAAGALLLVGSSVWSASASAGAEAGPRPAAAVTQVNGTPSPVPHASATQSSAADAIVEIPSVPPNACTVTVNGEKIHGTSPYGSSWCCHENAAGNEECFNCDAFTCSRGWNLTGPGGGIPEFVEP